MRTLSITLLIGLVAGGASTVAAQHQQKCMTAKRPDKLPSVGSLLDSSAAAAAFSSRTLPAGGIVFSVVSLMDSVQVVRVVEPSVVDSLPQALAVFRSALEPQRAPEVWGVRVRVRPGGAMAVERSRYCPPEVLSSSNEILRFDVWAEDRPPTNGGHPVRITIEATLSEVGDVVRTDILRSSGIQDLDREFAQSFARQKFMPALLDSVPVTSWIRSDGKTLKL